MKTQIEKELIEGFNRSIILAADSIEKLREPDVMRVLQDYFFTYGYLAEITDYIILHRPDLTKETRDCAAEIWLDYSTPA